MKSSQSAYILDAMPTARRIEILTEGQRLQQSPFAEILNLEKDLRESVEKLPANFFSSAKDDIDYWKQVVNESQDQDALLDELEKTNPEIYPEVAKSRFKLDEAMGLPPQLLKRVLSETDNEELGMALLTLPEDLVNFFMAVISPKRKALLEEQIASMRGNIPKTKLVESRLSLTKRFKEAMA
jgi:flagellar motor switch protein FliG